MATFKIHEDNNLKEKNGAFRKIESKDAVKQRKTLAQLNNHQNALGRAQAQKTVTKT